MTKTDVAGAAASAEPIDLRAPAKPLKIDPANCIIQANGYAFKEVFCRLPRTLSRKI
jgi:hypothetical protein